MSLDLLFAGIVLFISSTLLCIYVFHGDLKGFLKKMSQKGGIKNLNCSKIICISLFITFTSIDAFVVLLSERQSRSDVYVFLKVLTG